MLLNTELEWSISDKTLQIYPLHMNQFIHLIYVKIYSLNHMNMLQELKIIKHGLIYKDITYQLVNQMHLIKPISY